MKYFLGLLFLLSFCITSSYAQEETYYEMTKADELYREARMRKSVPPYGLHKIQGLIKAIESQQSDDADEGIEALKPQQYKSLSLREKFTYTMINPEMYSQNCAIFVPVPEENKKIFGQLMSWVDECTWSDRQMNFLRENRDSVMGLIKESTLRSKKMGVNYKDALVLIHAWESIPFIIDYYQSNPLDKDALTVLLLLMKNGEFIPFLESLNYSILYDLDYTYEAWINYNTDNEALIVKQARAYYTERKNNK